MKEVNINFSLTAHRKGKNGTKQWIFSSKFPMGRPAIINAFALVSKRVLKVAIFALDAKQNKEAK